MSAFIQHFSFEFRTGIRNKTLLMMNYLLPLGFYAVVGLLMTQVNPFFTETMIPAMVIFAILAATLLGLPDPLVSAREAGIFRSYKVNGVPATSILVIPALTTNLHLIITSAIITATAPALFDAPWPVHWPAFVLIFFLTAFCLTGLGLLIGVISSSTRMTVLWSQSIYLPSMILGGLMMPFSILPEALQRFSMMLPTTQSMNAFRGLALGLEADFNPLWSILILLAGGVLAFGLAIYLFNWDSKNKTRRGHPLMALLALLPYFASLFLPL
jgi:ABC-2 type transport system permease protein